MDGEGEGSCGEEDVGVRGYVKGVKIQDSQKGVQESVLGICVHYFYLACPVRETFFWVYNYSGLLAAVSHLPNFVSTAMPHLHIVDCTKRVCL